MLTEVTQAVEFDFVKWGMYCTCTNEAVNDQPFYD